MGAPVGNKNAEGPHQHGGEKTAMRAEALRAELKGMRERKEFSSEYWDKMAHLESMTPKPENKQCGVYMGSGPLGSGTANKCRLPKGHAEERHRSWGSGLVTESGEPMLGKFGKR